MSEINKQGLTEEQFLSSYDASQYDRLSVTVDMLIFTVTEEEEKNYRRLPEKSLRLLLIRRGNHPYKHQWALPGGFVQLGESLDEAARRKLKEETNISDIYMEQLYTWGDVDRDPRTRVICASYMALVDHTSLQIETSRQVAGAAWFTVVCKLYQEQKTVTPSGYILQQLFHLTLSHADQQLSATIKTVKTVETKVTTVTREIVACSGIAFDHAKIIEYGIQRLRNKIEYTDIAFNLMPERFTLTKLQQVYEIILDTELLKANFRRKIADMVVETDEYTRDAGHRPSKLFKFNPKWMKIID